jgi:predicted nucleic acid-binding protein
MTLVDTGYLIALFRPGDQLHACALRWSDALNGPTIVTDYVLVEVVNALSRVEDRPAAHQMLDYLMGDPLCEIVRASDELLRAGVKLHRERPDKEWSLTDCISFVVMEHRAIRQALTHDHHFEQAGFEALLRRNP